MPLNSKTKGACMYALLSPCISESGGGHQKMEYLIYIVGAAAYQISCKYLALYHIEPCTYSHACLLGPSCLPMSCNVSSKALSFIESVNLRDPNGHNNNSGSSA